MRKAKINTMFAMIQWHGDEYPYYEQDAEDNQFQHGDEVEVLREATPNPMGKLFVIYNPRTNESATVTESYLEFLD